MDKLDMKKARDLAVIAKAANDLRKHSGITSDIIFELVLDGIRKVPDRLQMMVDQIVVMQKKFPMPEEGWQSFIEDLEHTNKKHGLNLHIKPELLE